jgi:hypothetical protein
MGCGAERPPAPRPAPPPVEAEAPPLGPARWLYTDRLGALFDDAGRGASLPRPEPAVIDGVRVIVDGGLVVASARAADRLSGFRALPERLGGGFVIWSEDRVYRADEFLGELTAVADVGASGGVRPWLSSILLRTPSGLLELDPASLALRRAGMPGIADALALDARRAVRVDALGRASFTVDGGASWIDVLRTRGAVVSSLHEVGGELVLGADPAPDLVLGRSGDLHPRREATSSDPRPVTPLSGAFPPSARGLPGELLAHAVALGALLPGRRILVTRADGIRVFTAETGLPIADVDLPGVDERFSRCQAVTLGSPRARLACSNDAGAVVLDLDGALARPALEAVFPESSGFLAGPAGRFAFDGRCGPEAPRSGDLGAAVKPEQDATCAPGDPLCSPSTAPQPAPAPPPPPDAPPADDARVCVRAGEGHWIERRLRGDDARRLYRWVPGDGGAVTALVLGREDDDDLAKLRPRRADEPDAKKEPAKPREERVPPGDGVRVIRVDPGDPALAGGAFPARRAPQRDVPFRSVEVDFWQGEGGAIHGWIHLPAEGERAPEPSPQGPAKRMFRLAPSLGGRMAGVRIDVADPPKAGGALPTVAGRGAGGPAAGDGKVTVLPLPEGVAQVVTGGRFGLAMGRSDGADTWFETLDGGAAWTPVEGPPVGRIEGPHDNLSPSACSPMGCTWGSGLVRLGWGGPRPKPRSDADLKLGPAKNPKPRDARPAGVTCRLDADRATWLEAAASQAPARPAKPVRPAPKAPKPPGKPGAAPRPGAKPADVASPPLPIALGLRSASIGALHDHAWSGEVVPPFQPGAGRRHLTANDPALTSTLGGVIPILGAGRDPVDLLLVVDRRRLRAGAPSAQLLPFDLPGKITVAADGPGGALVTLDADRGVVAITSGEASAAAIHLTRVPDVTQTRLTLARRPGGGLALVGYSIQSGEVFAGDLDLGRASVGPLSPLGSLETIAEASLGACRSAKATHRFLAESPVALRVLGKGGAVLLEQVVTMWGLVAASADRLCVEGIEAALPGDRATVLGASFARRGETAVRIGEKVVRGVCTIDKR